MRVLKRSVSSGWPGGLPLEHWDQAWLDFQAQILTNVKFSKMCIHCGVENVRIYIAAERM